MTEQIETIIYTDDDVRLSVAEWDDGGAWISIQLRGASAYTSLTRKQAEDLVIGLQAVLSKESV